MEQTNQMDLVIRMTAMSIAAQLNANKLKIYELRTDPNRMITNQGQKFLSEMDHNCNESINILSEILRNVNNQ